MRRRDFVKACAVGAGCAGLAPASLFADAGLRPRRYQRSRLVQSSGEPLRLGELEQLRNYVFSYPYRATPAFLLDLGTSVPGEQSLRTEAGETYRSRHGVGPKHSVVAFSAICAHKLAHPTPAVSYIRFREARGNDEPATGVISCCAENSLYDPVAGGRVLDGPAKQPLAAVLLEHDAAADELFAVGTLGGELFDRFFTEFEARLSLEYPDGNAREAAAEDVVVEPLSRFSDNIMRC
ncbi:Rieske 2Fe-2S domain-containing protein [Methylonatrum kenyense]|uniref:twin-arginine translocation signal domain-containing protein n=1 Tax=Methylonatrum kenyense TaxID=455253 RepID=UPI0020BFFD57|nr:twin-arginine translocation signal domain-containing protein [Methylonatrum kenyense]MCK8514825.1 Rieske 2Fe-2S domain-containing protein [Methylonatrum kenyense]